MKEENEKIIQTILNIKNVEVVPIPMEQLEGVPLLPCQIAGAICVCPTNLYEGFFICKLRKV